LGVEGVAVDTRASAWDVRSADSLSYSAMSQAAWAEKERRQRFVSRRKQIRVTDGARQMTGSHPFRTIALYKPYDVLCQFSDRQGRPTLKALVPFAGIYPVGRLDRDSEGLLILTDDGRLSHRLADPRFEHPKTYFVQVERVPSAGALRAIRRGID